MKNPALQHNSCSSEFGNCPGLAHTEAGGGQRPSPLSLCLSHCEGVSHQSGPHPEVSESTWPQVLLAGCSLFLLAKGLEAAAARSRASKCLWKRPAPPLGIFASLPRPLSKAVPTPLSHHCVMLATSLAESHRITESKSWQEETYFEEGEKYSSGGRVKIVLVYFHVV